MIDDEQKVHIIEGHRAGDVGYVAGHAGDADPRDELNDGNHKFRVRFSDGEYFWYDESQLEVEEING